MKATLGIRLPLAGLLCLTGIFEASASIRPGTVVAWGNDGSGQTSALQFVTNAVAVAGGAVHSLVLETGGKVVAWGYNGFGQTNVPPDLTNAVAIAAGGEISVALRADGTAVSWGKFGTVVYSNVVAISAGEDHVLVVKANSTVAAWGDNSKGQTDVPLGLTNVVSVSGGRFHSLALKSDGSLVTWGKYWNGNGWVSMFVPVNATNIVAICSAYDYSLALREDGNLLGWGWNSSGQTTIPLSIANITQIAAGHDHSIALKANGTMLAWGSNLYGQTNVPFGLTNVEAIAAGGYHNLSISMSPVVWLKPPATISVAPGANTNLNVTVGSGSPFTSRWSFNGSPVDGVTTPSLLVSSCDLSKAGAYSVTISNHYGYVVDAQVVLRMENSPVVLVSGVDVGGGKVDRVDSAQIVMTNTGSGAAIYFTLDGSTPDFTDSPYAGPFTLTNSATIRAIAYNFAFTESAEAAPITVEVWPTYPLSATTPGGGSIGLSPAPYSAGNRYVSNTVVTLTASPANNWSFLGWTGDSSATSNVTSVLMDRARTVTGVFGTALNLFTNGSGQVQLNPPTGPYAFGSIVKLTALPAPGFYFFGWANAASGFGNPLTFTATNAAGLTANFGALAGNHVSLVVLPNGNGTVSVNPAKNVYTNGEPVTLTAWPAANQTFTGWSSDATGNLNPLVLALTSSKLITANFAPGAPTNPPVITQPPLSRTLSAGANTLLSFALTGDGPFAYQWRLNHSPIPGATNPTLNLVGVTPTDAGRYEIVVIGAGGAVTSTPASVAIFGMQLIPSGGSPLPLLILDGAVGTQYRLETSPNLSFSNWSLLSPLTLPTARFYYADTASSNQPTRFYRAVPQ